MKLWAVVLASVLATCGFIAGAQGADLTEGKDYTRLRNPQAVETGKKIEVIEFFSYGCPHCNDLEPILDGWLAKMPSDVQFRRVPVMFQERWIPLARIYYTLDALGVEPKLSPEVFKAIHVSNMPLWQDKTFFDWAATQGLDRAKVADTFNSFAINSKINRARSLAQAYNVQAVPTMVVDGKFETESSRIGGHANVPNALDVLISRARAERAKG